LAKQNIIVSLLLSLFTLLVFSSIPVAYATSNNTSTILAVQPVQDQNITSKGCGEGYGYVIEDPTPICEPVDKIGQGPPPDQAFCAALGCPYNPPTHSELPSESDGNSNDNFATTPVTPTEKTAAEEAREGDAPVTELDPGNEDQNDDGGNGSNNDEEGGNGDSGSGEEGDSSGGDETEEE
jgi:hypothetical protein